MKTVDTSSELDLSARFNARMLLLVATIYPLWSLYLYFFQPREYDEPLGRIAVSLWSIALWSVIRFYPKAKQHAASLALLGLLALTLHFNWLTYQNSLSDIYVLGAAVVAAGTSVMFDRTKHYLIYAAATVLSAFVIALLLWKSNAKASMFFVAIFTIQTVIYFSLSARFAALKSLKAVREANLEMKKQILENELFLAKHESAQLRQLSLHDKVTGFPNREQLDQNLQLSMKRFRQEGLPFTILFIDLDGFKAVNDTFGHSVGDQVLIAAAQRIKASLRRSDMVARQGGDEFVAILAGVDNPVTIERIRSTIADALSKTIDVGEVSCQIGGSIGHAVCPRDGSDLKSLLKFADDHMYRVKRSRKAKRGA